MWCGSSWRGHGESPEVGDLPTYPLAPTEALPGAVFPWSSSHCGPRRTLPEAVSLGLAFFPGCRQGWSESDCCGFSQLGAAGGRHWPGLAALHPILSIIPHRAEGPSTVSCLWAASESLAGLDPGGPTGPQETLLLLESSSGAVIRDAALWSLHVARASLQRGGPRLLGFLARDWPVPNERAESRVEAAWPFVTQPRPDVFANFLLFWQSSHMLPWFQGRGVRCHLTGVCEEWGGMF